MEKHLNLFYSYNQGNLSSSERIKQLEDNLTRALIVTLRSLEVSTQVSFLNLLLSKNIIHSKSFVFDLQNTKRYKPRSDTAKFLIILQRDKSNFTLKDFQNLDTSFLENKTDFEKKEIEKDIRKHITSESQENFQINNTDFKFSELNSLLQFFYGNRPDAWIISEKEVILFETKIGYNSASKYQIYRHITGKSGLNLKPQNLKNNNANLSIINITWEEIGKIFQSLKSDVKQTEHFLISQFLEYISMTGQKLNLEYLVKGEFESELHREQFSLFLNQFDKKIVEKKLPFKRHHRTKAGLWEPYGIEISENVISKNPHYTIGFWESEIGISLTTNNHKQINAEFLRLLENYFSQKTQKPYLLKRYAISLKKYHLVDWKKGDQRGETDDSFEFYFEFSEIKSNFSALSKIISELTKLKIYKQLDFIYQIRFFDFSKIREKGKESQIRYLNKHLLENPTELIEEFVSFMEETSAMYNQMNK
ncbi:MAG: hypothetical protein M3Q33_12385 [Acidobacteriota bacterium]|nr:hypothetical protein [Acidobacteriota bacterium]